MNPTISIVVPVYNVEQYLHKCINSIINQTYKALEIILVNDGSPDNSDLICDEFAKKDNRIRVIHQKNKGLSGARNSGLEIATGDYIGFVDSDDWIHEKMYATLIDEAKRYQSNLVYCTFINSNATLNEDRLKDQNAIVLNKKQLILNYLEYGFYVQRNLYSKKLIKNLRFDEKIPFVEDVFFAANIIDKVDLSVFVEFPFYIYNVDNETSLTRVNYNKNRFLSLEANLTIQKKVKEIFPHDAELHNKLRERIIGNCLFHLQNLYEKKNADLDKDDAMKIKSKKTYNKNFRFFKHISLLKTIIRFLNVSILHYFYRIYFFKQKII